MSKQQKENAKKRKNTRKGIGKWQPIACASAFVVAVFALILLGHLLYTAVAAVISSFTAAVAATFTAPIVCITLGVALVIFSVLTLIRHDQQTFKKGRKAGADGERQKTAKIVKEMADDCAAISAENERLRRHASVGRTMRNGPKDVFEESDFEDSDFKDFLADLAGE